jgi:5-methyltetrahydrofolate--homocysteine methyltransferase
VMKSAVAYLEPFMDKADATSKGTMVLATVKGDVHDIGKNLVDIILTNNGYRVVNLGIKCPVETMLHAAEEHGASAIGMSGLLVKSTLIMKENLEVMNERQLSIPVILGGAALTRRYVEQDLRQIYAGKVLYANDAFDGLRYMEQIAAGTVDYPAATGAAEDEKDLTGTEAKIAMAEREDARYTIPPGPAGGAQRSAVRTDVSIPAPPFWGTRVIDDIPLADVFAYINEVALIRGQWQVRKGKLAEDQYRALLNEKILPELARLKERRTGSCNQRSSTDTSPAVHRGTISSSTKRI